MGRGSKAMQAAGSEQALMAFARLVKGAGLLHFNYALGTVRKAKQARTATMRLRRYLGEQEPPDLYGIVRWKEAGWAISYVFIGKEARLIGLKQ